MKKAFLLPLALAGMMVATAASAQSFKLCTGRDDGNYFKAGHMLKSKLGKGVEFDVVTTQGSIENLDRITRGECQGAFVQSDALLVYSSRNGKAISTIERAGVLYQEQVNLLCNRSLKLGRIVDLTKANTVAVGPDGSGARTTWDAFVLADKKRYSAVQVDTRAGVRALSAVADGSQVSCLLYVGALGAPFLKSDAQMQGDRVVLVDSYDRDMPGVAKDARGAAVYTYGKVPSGTYPRIQPSGAVYGTKELDTMQVDALFIANADWISANETAYDRILKGFAAAKPGIEKLAHPE